MNHTDIVFGPVLSRRLGRSLGVDLLMEKICCQDCIYCEVGRTRQLTSQRKEYIPAAEVIRCLDRFLASPPPLDYITYSGMGEPTLSTAIGPVTAHIKQHYPQYKVCVLTNGMLLGNADVQRDLAPADLVIPSLDASCAGEYLKVNRPVADISYETFLAGLRDFCSVFTGEIRLELFIVPGANDSDEAVGRFADIIKTLKVSQIQLNSLDRPGTEEDVAVPSKENAMRFLKALSPLADTLIV